MADDMRRAVGALPWVNKVQVTLGEHMYADKINHGLAHGLSFQATFGNEASAELDELRRTFLVKAFQRRQEAVLRYLIERGHQPAGMGLIDLQALPLDEAGARLRTRYLEKRDTCARPDEPHAFVDSRGNPIDELAPYLRALERVSITPNSTALCAAVCSQPASARMASQPCWSLRACPQGRHKCQK